MSATHYNTDDMNVQRTGNQDLKATTAGASVVLPYMDNNEINKKLEEHSKLLKEWEDLLNRTGIVYCLFHPYCHSPNLPTYMQQLLTFTALAQQMHNVIFFWYVIM